MNFAQPPTPNGHESRWAAYLRWTRLFTIGATGIAAVGTVVAFYALVRTVLYFSDKGAPLSFLLVVTMPLAVVLWMVRRGRICHEKRVERLVTLPAEVVASLPSLMQAVGASIAVAEELQRAAYANGFFDEIRPTQPWPPQDPRISTAPMALAPKRPDAVHVPSTVPLAPLRKQAPQQVSARSSAGQQVGAPQQPLDAKVLGLQATLWGASAAEQPAFADGRRSPSTAPEGPGTAEPQQAGRPDTAALLLDQLPGQILGRTWQVGPLLGRGGMGAVFRARHLRTSREYALKMLLPNADGANDARALARFEKEATAASGLGHPGIVQVHDFEKLPGGGAYLVMDLLVGESLAQRLARSRRGGKLPFPEVLTIATEVGEALTAAHALGLVHRDVKPGNIFLVAEPRRSVLVDFGLVKAPRDARISMQTRSGEVLGTPLYMAPEQALGHPVDGRTDLYGLGVVIYEAVVGLPPVFEASLAAAYEKLLHEEAAPVSVAERRFATSTGPLPDLPPYFDAVMAKALATSPNDRYATVAEFVAALHGK